MIGSILAMQGKPLLTADWQVWVCLGVVVTGIMAMAIVVVIWNTRRR